MLQREPEYQFHDEALPRWFITNNLESYQVKCDLARFPRAKRGKMRTHKDRAKFKYNWAAFITW